MKRLVVVIIIAVAGLVAYNYFTTGELKLVPSASLTQDEKELKHLEDQFLEAQRKSLEGSRGASIGGIDTPADVIGAMRDVEQIEARVTALKALLRSESAKTRADELLGRIETFKKSHD
jgi:predicted negative regulator of RcsB-dependent stress response